MIAAVVHVSGRRIVQSALVDERVAGDRVRIGQRERGRARLRQGAEALSTLEIFRLVAVLTDQFADGGPDRAAADRAGRTGADQAAGIQGQLARAGHCQVRGRRKFQGVERHAAHLRLLWLPVAATFSVPLEVIGPMIAHRWRRSRSRAETSVTPRRRGPCGEIDRRGIHGATKA